MAVTARRLNRYQVQLTWDLGELRNVDPATITRYRIFRSIDGGSATLIGQATVSNYTDLEAFFQPTRHYAYEVKASTGFNEFSLGMATPSEKVATGLAGVVETALLAESSYLAWGFEHFGEMVTVYRRKEVGDKCGRCWNPDEGSVPKADCEECFGTGIQGGYNKLEGVDSLFRLSEDGLVTDTAGLVYEKTPTVFFLPTYIFATNDVVVRSTGVRYLLGRSRHAEIQNQVAFQRFDLDVLPSESILYRLP